MKAGCALLLAACTLLAGCGEHTSFYGPRITVGTALAQQQVLNRQISASPRTFDPSLATDVASLQVLDDLFEGLVTLDVAGHVAPGVATRWTHSADGLTWTFHLRRDALWSNGKPVTAYDFVYSWRRIVTPATASGYAQALGAIVGALDINAGKLPPTALGVDTPDPYTLVVHLTQPTPYFLDLLTNMYFFPEYAPAIEKWGDAWTRPGHLVSNGPFMLQHAVINGAIRLVKNPHFHDAKNVRLTQVTFHPVSDGASAVSQYLAGTVDWTNTFPANDYQRLKKALGDQVVQGPYFGTAMLGFNLTRPPFKDNRKLRLALSMAVDREVLAKYLNHGLVTPAYNLIPPLEGYTPAIPDWAKLPEAQRHARARELYAEAGYSKAKPLKTTLTFSAGGAGTRQFMEALQAMWQINLGAQVTINTLQFKVLLQSLRTRTLDLYWSAWIGDFPDPFTFMQLFQHGFQQNNGDYDNPRFDALVEQAQKTVDQQARYALFTQAEALLNHDAPYLPMYFYQTAHLIKPYVKGWQSNNGDRNLSRYMYILAHKEG
ncbi:MAG: peptide ABC transporter substrate-binding protein [Nevskiaceae bacterium]|nr:MAG: peptide ABC transporter substrate-binding protein [Nevskiaceae bacterium]TBR72068.1 MAG: peptide ABC transporter substrate-binding protein [Nevskiaceae bacterium]